MGFPISIRAGMVLATVFVSGCAKVSQNDFTGVKFNALENVSASSLETTKVFRTLQPALAVRGAACLACHANVQSNIVTDFGHGDSYFLDPGLDQNANGSLYFNHALSAWQTATVSGAMIVPRVQLERPAMGRQMNTVDPQKHMNSMSLAQLVSLPVTGAMDGGGGSSAPLAVGFNPKSGPAVIEKSTVYIGAPQASDILALAPTLANVNSGFVQFGVGVNPPVSLVASGAGANAYLRNDSAVPFNCYGDVVVKGTLFLKSLDIHTDNNGCRLYVAGSVFVQGNVRIDGDSSGSHNLQITSSKAILMGFDPTTLGDRLSVNGSRTWVLPAIFTRGAGTNMAKGQSILDDSAKIPDLVDAGTNQVSMSHMLLNAPQVHSRYEGAFTGAVIGEVVLFRLGQFAFQFDPIFQNVPIFPILQSDILKIAD